MAMVNKTKKPIMDFWLVKLLIANVGGVAGLYFAMFLAVLGAFELENSRW